ncbi:LytTR family transcriptional regulator [Shewanella submarina]|uniref:LytTR family DNA-binding domain-containing protein n=1 Tax=Shewanella submarina TaxID=2016376 RepID=A0ABV7GEP6_9GAMM|nr:LytTR family DNA-binding domain-containing protein [Shewanella submarina]MCL1037830.1 LytTR family transcriptional regulator [Shewanella submarina]
MMSIGQHLRSLLEHRLWRLSAVVCVLIVALAIFQDYLHATRNGSSFFILESLLFKVFWMLFPPMLLALKVMLQKRPANTLVKMSLTVIVSTVIHLLLMALTIWLLSSIFREQNYGFFKVLTYSLANDLVVAILTYGLFVWLLRYFELHRQEQYVVNESPLSPEYLVIQSGKLNVKINLADIVSIKSATPYVTVYTEDKDYLYTETLKSIMNKLDDRFVRVHRSSIVNMDKVLMVKSRLNGDYDLFLKDGSETRLSRNYVSEFKTRFESSHQVNQ